MNIKLSVEPGVLVVHGATPSQDPERPARARVEAQSRAARDCLAEAARRLGAPPGPWDKNANDAPRPVEGWFWSLSHDSQRVAAALARCPVGVDLEALQLRRKVLVERVLDRGERLLLGGEPDALAFTRVWTAKEAVLKASGVGLGELSRCRLLAWAQREGCLLAHRGRVCRVVQTTYGEHVLSVHAQGARFSVDWVELEPLR